ncbi:MAG: hypothetical protein PUJ55_14770 [Clostridiales bacterium]|nr:hypothetical protein [Roseburia sp.]MDD7638184.1 hypothetical protein [Clostridiales bacterium]MDY4113666.1 hypothetical protein [Roseburia sp.]
MEKIIEQAGIPLLIFAVCVYYGMRLLILHDVSAIRGKDKPPVKDEKAYAMGSGKLILFFGAATLVMALLSFVNVYAAVAEIIVCTFIMGVLWKKMNDRYGA